MWVLVDMMVVCVWVLVKVYRYGVMLTGVVVCVCVWS